MWKASYRAELPDSVIEMRDLRRLRRAIWPRRRAATVSRFAASSLMLAALVGVICGLATCASLPPAGNPPATMLEVSVIVLDHETADRKPATLTLLSITLTAHEPGTKSFNLTNSATADTPTLICDHVTMTFAGLSNGDSPVVPLASFIGVVPPPLLAYQCTYSWKGGEQSATLTIPVLIPTLPHIQSPGRDAFLPVPERGGTGVTISYSNASNAGVGATAVAGDYNGRLATSGAAADSGSVTIGPQEFPPAFSDGWGTLSLRRSAGNVDLESTAGNSAFAAVKVTVYEQVSEIPVFWL